VPERHLSEVDRKLIRVNQLGNPRIQRSEGERDAAKSSLSVLNFKLAKETSQIRNRMSWG